jgi:hypothetical protein
MKTHIFSLLCLLLGTGAALGAQQNPASRTPGPSGATIGRIADLEWRGPPGGMQMTHLAGVPTDSGKPYTLAMKLRDGAWIPPHWHPESMHIVVLSGALLFGTGDTLDKEGAKVVTAGGHVDLAAKVHHYEGAQGETIVLMTGIGPLRTFPVNPNR